MKKIIYMLLVALTIVGIIYLPETKPNVSPIKMSVTVSIMGNEFKVDKRQIQLILSKNLNVQKSQTVNKTIFGCSN